jgi:putative hydrolase of HD superfamily
MTDTLINQMQFLAEADKLKTILRQTYITDKTRQENSAEHSWHFALTAMTLYEYCSIEGVSLNRVVQMAVIHDFVEIYAGDTYAYDDKGNETKDEREQAAADKLFGLLPSEQAKQFRSLWEEFDRMETPDAIYANAVDRLQSHHNIHLSGGITWKNNGATSDRIYKRMAVVKTALPELWGYVESTINEGLKKGYIGRNAE